MVESKRKSGLELVGEVPWGTHFCQFYLTKDDLTDILVPYFKAGLESNEFCMWITSEPLAVEDVHKAMAKAVPDYRRYVERGQIEVLPYTDWYVRDGGFDSARVLQGWVDKLTKALAEGFDGLRLTGNTFWLEEQHWKEFTSYEETINNVIGRYRMLALCTYSLEKCGASEVMDVVANHQFALIKRAGSWESVVSSEGRKAEQALRESEQRYRSLFDAMTEGFGLHEIICDDRGEPRDYRFIDVNQAFERHTGLKRAEVIGHTAREVMPSLESFWIETYGKVALTGEPVHFERHAASLGRDYEVFAYSPGPRLFAALLVDVTARLEMEKELARLASFPQLNPNPVLEIDAAGDICYANPASIKRFPELKESRLRPAVLDALMSVARKLEHADQDVSVRELGADGYWYQVVCYYVRASGHLRVYAVDITERKHADEARSGSETRLARSQEIAHLGSWELDLVKNELVWSDEVYRIFGVQPQEFGATYEAFIEMVHPDDRAAVEQVYSRSLVDGCDTYEIEHRIVRKSTGEVRVVHEKCDHIRDESGRVVRSAGMVHDITERKRAEEKIREQNAIVSGINRIFRETLGAETEEQLGRICLGVTEEVTGSTFGFLGEINVETGRLDDIAISDPGWRACRTRDPSGHGKRVPKGFKIQGIYGRVLLDGKGFFTNDPASHPDSSGTPEGHPALTAFLGVPLIQNGKTIGMVALGNRGGGYRNEDLAALEALAGPIVQVLMRRRAEQALHESENRFRSLADNAPSVFLRFDKSLRILYASPRAREFAPAVDSSRSVGRTIEDSGMPENLVEPLTNAVEQVFRTGQNKEVEVDLAAEDGARTFIMRLAPELGSSGGVEHVLGVATDITNMKKAAGVLERDREELKRLVEEKTRELIATQLEIEKAKRLSDIGTLAATVAHELRNPLGAMNLAIFNLRRKTSDPALQGHFKTIERKIAESSQIIENLLFYSRLRPPTYRSVKLQEIITEALGTLRARAQEKKIKTVKKITGIADLMMEADPLQIKELLINIINNAYDAVGEENGTIEVGASLHGDDSVRIHVKDNGKGIDKEQMDRIWEPFFSTKSKGTGLGLSVCRQIATLHNGTIEIKSKKGKGTTAAVVLPLRRGAPAK